MEKPILQHGIIPNKVIPRAAALLEVTHTSLGTAGWLCSQRIKLLGGFEALTLLRVRTAA